ncbi:hypothetical protein [Lutibacter citreus]|uniref:hypothetical protein n=1 Tax=Lutibacter citreus TaxID=2138210 RepID=UPI000DBE3D10|nr:hypothetical protein [Lutibacter citreus]
MFYGTEVGNQGYGTCTHVWGYVQAMCQNGYEYAASSLMMWQDMPYHSLSHIWYMHNNRYIGSKRNPWCIIEWGLHYSRSMASYGHFIEASGFEYHGPKGYMAFSPKITPWNFKAPFTAAEGWGTFEQIQKKGKQRNNIQVNYGKLSLKTCAFDAVNERKITKLNVSINGGEAKNVSFIQNKNRLTIVFKDKIIIPEESLLMVELK